MIRDFGTGSMVTMSWVIIATVRLAANGTHCELKRRQVEHGAYTFVRLYLRDRAAVEGDDALAPCKRPGVRASGRTVGKHPRQPQIVLGDEAAAEAESLELALAEKRLVRRSGVDEAESVNRIIDAVVGRNVRAEGRQEREQFLGRRKLAGIDIGGQQVVPEIPRAHVVEHELLLALERACGHRRRLIRSVAGRTGCYQQR